MIHLLNRILEYYCELLYGTVCRTATAYVPGISRLPGTITEAGKGLQADED